jgi:hypothetical protein
VGVILEKSNLKFRKIESQLSKVWTLNFESHSKFWSIQTLSCHQNSENKQDMFYKGGLSRTVLGLSIASMSPFTPACKLNASLISTGIFPRQLALWKTWTSVQKTKYCLKYFGFAWIVTRQPGNTYTLAVNINLNMRVALLMFCCNNQLTILYKFTPQTKWYPNHIQ